LGLIFNYKLGRFATQRVPLLVTQTVSSRVEWPSGKSWLWRSLKWRVRLKLVLAGSTKNQSFQF